MPNHVQLDNEPRKKKGATVKTVSISNVEDLKSAIICKNLETDMEEVELEPIQIPILVELGRSFCGIAPEQLNNATVEENRDG